MLFIYCYIYKLTSAYFCHVTNEPMSPIEKGSSWCARMWSHSCHERLDKAQNRGCETDRSVYCLGTPPTQFHEYYHEGCDRHRPREYHKEPVPLGEKIDNPLLQKTRKKVTRNAFFLRHLNINDIL